MENAPQDPDGIIIFGFLLMVINNVLVKVDIAADIYVLGFYLDCYKYLAPYKYAHPGGTDWRANITSIFVCSFTAPMYTVFQKKNSQNCFCQNFAKFQLT